MKTLKIFLVLIVLVFLTARQALPQYLDTTTISDVSLPLYSGSAAFAYFDVAEISIVSPVYLDLVSGLNILQSPNINMGIWNINQRDGSFSNYNNFYNGTNTPDIKGIIFMQLRAGHSKDVVIIKGEGLRVHQNQFGSIQQDSIQSLSLGGTGFELDTGYFSTEGAHADLVVRVNDNNLKFFKNNYNGYLSELYSCSLGTLITGVKMRQMDDRYIPYAPNNPLNRDDVILSRSITDNLSRIEVYRNNNNNGLGSLFDSVSVPFSISDFQVADFDEDGYNDIIVSGHVTGKDNIWQNNIAYIFKNVQGQFLNHNPVVEFNAGTGGYAIGNMTKIAVADFNKDGWNDLIFTSEALLNQNTYGLTSIFINQKTTPLFNTGQQGCAQHFFMRPQWDAPVCVKALDIYNTGGIAFLASWTSYFPHYGIKLVNTTTEWRNPPPPPPIVQAFLEYDDTNHIWHPHIRLNNRGERDFDHYEIWKWRYGWPSPQPWVIRSDTGYTDSSECVDATGQDSPWWNCYYFAKQLDNTQPLPQESLPSQPALFSVCYPGCGSCTPVCEVCGGDSPVININQLNERLQLKGELPSKYSLFNYPNPFNPVTKIRYDIPKTSHIIIKIYDLIGRELVTLVNEIKNPGRYEVEFNAAALASGIYVYKMIAGNFSSVRKMVLIK